MNTVRKDKQVKEPELQLVKEEEALFTTLISASALWSKQANSLNAEFIA